MPGRKNTAMLVTGVGRHGCGTVDARAVVSAFVQDQPLRVAHREPARAEQVVLGAAERAFNRQRLRMRRELDRPRVVHDERVLAPPALVEAAPEFGVRTRQRARRQVRGLEQDHGRRLFAAGAIALVRVAQALQHPARRGALFSSA